MRALTLSIICVICMCSGVAARDGAPTGASSEEAEVNLERDQWNGRQHILFDKQNRRTTGSSAKDLEDCRSVPTRLRRSDGTTVVKRINKCEE